MKKYTRETLARDYKKIGLKGGDVVLVRASLKSIGAPDLENKQDHVDAILDVIGERGTLVGLSFSRSFARPFCFPPKNFVFDENTPAITGGFVNLMLLHPERQRSKHPTNSFVAIGEKANEILSGHDEREHSYYPMEKLLAQNGKMLLVGCIEDSPGFTTVHLAEYNLGLLKKIMFPWIHRVFYSKNGEVRLFKRAEVGGDSNTFSKFYPLYREKNLLKEGLIGEARSMMICCQDAYELECDVLKSNPKFCICDDKNCFNCCGRNIQNIYRWPQFYLRRVLSLFKKSANFFAKVLKG